MLFASERAQDAREILDEVGKQGAHRQKPTAWLGTVGIDWRVAGFGDFNGDGTSDMMLRNAISGAFELYDINNNAITAAFHVGTVGQDWLVAGFDNFGSNPGQTDMLLRNALTGEFEVYDIRNNAITSASSLGTVGIDWLVAGFGPISATGHSDMVLRNALSGAFEVYDIANNRITASASLGAAGQDWLVAGIGGNSQTPLGPSLSGSSQSAQLVQAMAGVGGDGVGANLTTPAMGADTSQQQFLTTAQYG
jgi:hypothetical protein